ncbi:MAG: hypothetical protein JXR75_08020 [Rhodobacteraceae bacterium]|nr:hypothetical protein [Paracoccaceae bacterium]
MFVGFLPYLADILFVASGLIGPDLPALVEGGLRQMQAPASVVAQITTGAPLRFGGPAVAIAQGVDAKAQLAKGETDVLIVTEAIPLAETLKSNDTPGQIAAFAALAQAANPKVRVLLHETWHSRKSGPGTVIDGDAGSGTAWRDRLTNDLALWEAVVRSARERGANVSLLPAGQAMARLADAVAAGKVPGISSMDDFFADDIHLSDKGQYFMALVHLSAITGETPQGLPAKMMRQWKSRDAVIPDVLATALQRIAWEAVSAYVPAPAAGAVPPKARPEVNPGATVTPATETVTAKLPTSAQVPFPLRLIDQTVLTPISNPNLAMGLNGISDWSVQQPFLNLMKSARDWTGHLPGQYGGWDHGRLAAAGVLDENGWLTAIPAEVTGVSTLLLVDLPATAGGMAGRYVLTHDGRGDLRIEGRVQNVQQAASRAVFDFTPGEGAVVLTILATDPADPIRNIVVVREDRAALLAQGQIFNPDWLARLRGVKTIRLMDWMHTNNSPLARLQDRPKPDDYTWTRLGAPVEIMVALANELDANPWFTLPHLAEDDLVRFYAEAARNGLEPGRIAHVEYSNEVWNWQFAQAAWAEDQGRARWGRDNTWVQYYALRAGEVASIWADVFGEAGKDRLVRVISTQTGWVGLEEQILNAPDILAEGRPAPATLFDAYAVTGYFSALLGSDEKAAVVRGWIRDSEAAARRGAEALGLSGAEAEAHFVAHRYDTAVELAASELDRGAITGNPSDSVTDLLTRVLPHQAKVARAHGLRLMMYEGGTHVVGQGAQVDDSDLAAFFIHLNYTPEMAALYDRLMQGWSRLTPEPFNAFVDVAKPGKWGSWGALRHLGDENPRWRVLAKGCHPC